MGGVLSKPVLDKRSSHGASRRYVYAISDMQGWRLQMEDAHTTNLNLLNAENEPAAFFAVFDGHGGSEVADYASTHLHHILLKQPDFASTITSFSSASAADDTAYVAKLSEALRSSFLKLDLDLEYERDIESAVCGCTAVCALLTETHVIVANAGDSRAVFSSATDGAVPMSFDHKPKNPEELKRIEEAGGYVEFERVNGNLALSRAFGDFEYKDNPSRERTSQMVSAEPEIIARRVDNVNDEFLIIACDGIWDCVSNEKCVKFVRYEIAAGRNLVQVCEVLMNICVADPKIDTLGVGYDNMTVVVIALLGGRSETEWFAMMRERYAPMLNEPHPLPMRRPSSAETEPDCDHEHNQPMPDVNINTALELQRYMSANDPSCPSDRPEESGSTSNSSDATGQQQDAIFNSNNIRDLYNNKVLRIVYREAGDDSDDDDDDDDEDGDEVDADVDDDGSDTDRIGGISHNESSEEEEDEEEEEEETSDGINNNKKYRVASSENAESNEDVCKVPSHSETREYEDSAQNDDVSPSVLEEEEDNKHHAVGGAKANSGKAAQSATAASAAGVSEQQ